MNKRFVILQDGWVFLVFPTLVLMLLGWAAASAGRPGLAAFCYAAAVLNTAFMGYFFRNPERTIPAEENLVVAGADGTVRAVESIPDVEGFSGRASRISIYLSPMDVHVNRAPINGTVTELGYTPGRHLLTIQNKASDFNEHSRILIENEQVTCLVKQIVGPLVRRVVYWLEPNQALARGEQIGMMKFGSRLDTYLPEEKVEVIVQPGESVRAGETVIARIKTV
jgi:phosphatidylserine decarboxylase